MRIFPVSRAMVTSAGEGINVCRYLVKGARKSLVREQKCRRRAKDESSSTHFSQRFAIQVVAQLTGLFVSFTCNL
jgi:hypothetical protein